jgi:hypothetical protein
MDARVAREISRSSRLIPKTIVVVLALTFLIGAALARPAGPQTGNYLGILTTAPLTLETDGGDRASRVDLDLVLDIAPREGGGHTVSVHDLDLSAPGVPTGAGASGDLDGDLKESGSVLVGPEGRFILPVTVALHYPLIDRVFPPSPRPFRETFGGNLTGTLAYNAEETAYTFEGTLHLTVRGASTGKLLVLDLPLDSVALYPDSTAP